MKHIFTLATLVFATACFGQESCPELWTACGEGTVWDEVSQTCVVANVSDTDFDGCVGINDFLVHLSFYGSGCGPEPAWACGDPLEYQGYDYETVQIGEQCWFAENLRTENYENGDAIPASLGNSEWTSFSFGATALYEENATYLDTFGRLYNWHAVDDDRGLCPSGWHVPTDEGWAVMTDHLGGELNAGVQMKADYGWNNGGNGTNSSGFSGLPCGYRSIWGDFTDAGYLGGFWSASWSGNNAVARYLVWNDNHVTNTDPSPSFGFSVRCIKDSE